VSKDRAFPPVLIIEDERNIATLVAQYLTHAGLPAHRQTLTHPTGRGAGGGLFAPHTQNNPGLPRTNPDPISR